MRGDWVLVRAYGDEPLIRRVWYTTDKAVFVVPEEEFESLGEDGDSGLIIGFPRADVFEHREGKVIWDECNPWKERTMRGNSKERFIICTYSSGMFEGEFAVELNIRGTVLSLFASGDDLEITNAKEGKGKLRVTIWDEAKGLIALPSETLEQGRRYLRYPINQLL